VDQWDLFSVCTGFQWDQGNSEKNWVKHRVSPFECEQIFFNQPLVVADDMGHSKQESRYYVFGKTDQGRSLYVVFTIRGQWVRVISARDMNHKERKVYDHHEKS
jgi:uncharacterized DUF497 family protein